MNKKSLHPKVPKPQHFLHLPHIPLWVLQYLIVLFFIVCLSHLALFLLFLYPQHIKYLAALKQHQRGWGDLGQEQEKAYLWKDIGIVIGRKVKEVTDENGFHNNVM